MKSALRAMSTISFTVVLPRFMRCELGNTSRTCGGTKQGEGIQYRVSH